MRQLKFKYVRASNFLCFSDVEINFETLSNIVLIRARNLDNSDNPDNSNNGVGKTSLMDTFTYALFGKTVKRPNKLSHSDVINHQTGKKLEVEFIWDNYRVVRT